MAIELRREVEQRLDRHRELGGSMVDRDLFRLRPGNAEHADNLAMSSHTVRAEIGGRADQEDVLFLLASKRAILLQNGFGKIRLRLNEIGAHGLSAEKIRNESEVRFDLRKGW